MAGLLLTLVAACGVFAEDEFIVHAVGEEGARDIVVVRGDGEERRVIKIGRAHVLTPVTSLSRMPSSA